MSIYGVHPSGSGSGTSSNTPHASNAFVSSGTNSTNAPLNLYGPDGQANPSGFISHPYSSGSNRQTGYSHHHHHHHNGSSLHYPQHYGHYEAHPQAIHSSANASNTASTNTQRSHNLDPAYSTSMISHQNLPTNVGHPHNASQINGIEHLTHQQDNLNPNSSFILAPQATLGGIQGIGGAIQQTPLHGGARGSGASQSQGADVQLSNNHGELNPMDVANSFVYQYYHMLHNRPQELFRFYDQDSKLSRTIDKDNDVDDRNLNSTDRMRALGQENINNLFRKCAFFKATCRIRVIEAQYLPTGGIIILVTGRIRHSEAENEREFVQTVFLNRQTPPRMGWYVANEIFCYLDGAVEEVALSHPQPTRNAEFPSSQEEVQHHDIPVVTTTEKQIIREEEIKEDKPVIVTTSQPSQSANKEIAPKGEVYPKTEVPVRSTPEKPKTAKWNTEVNIRAEDGKGANWPKPGEKKENVADDMESRRVGTSAMAVQHNYDPNSFAFKLVKNVAAQPSGPKGFAVPPLTANQGTDIAPVSGTPDDRARKGGSVRGKKTPTNGRARAAEENSPHLYHKKKIVILTELPDNLQMEELKNEIQEQLSKATEGQAVDIRKPNSGRMFGIIIELDSRPSAVHLVENGLYVRGRKVRVDFMRTNVRSSGQPRGTSNRPDKSPDGRRNNGGNQKANYRSTDDGIDNSHEGWIDARKRKPRAKGT